MKSHYSHLEKILHKIIFKNRFLCELLFDFENGQHKKNNPLPNINTPVFVTGLARAGTTALLNSLYDTNRFNSFTYNDMPFIFSPKMQKLFLVDVVHRL